MPAKILLVSHEMSITGAPRSLLEIGKVLARNQYTVDVWSYKDGPCKADYAKAGFRVEIVNEYDAFTKKEEIVERCQEYDLIICNTIRTYAYESVLKNYVPTIWLIQEAKSIYDYADGNQDIAQALRNKNNIYVVSEYAQGILAEGWKVQSRVIHNFVEDRKENFPNFERKDDTIRFIAVGSICYIKGYDLLLNAYNRLEKEYLEKSQLMLIGGCSGYEKEYEEQIRKKMRENSKVIYIGEICNHSEVLQRINESDVVIVFSRDESCSLVAIEAAMLEKPLIISRNVGARYLVSENAGWIVETEDVEGLRSVFREVIEKKNLCGRGKAARENYLRMSSYRAFESSVLEMVSSNLCDRGAYRALRKEDELKEEQEWICCGNAKWERMITELIKKCGSIRENSRIALYGAGEHARYIYPLLQKRLKVEIVCWVDKNYTDFQGKIKVQEPKALLKTEYDCILVAVINVNTFNSVISDLRELGVDLSRVAWLQWRGRL